MKIIGVAGGSGSGKSTFARLLSENLNLENVNILAQDSYYIDQSARFDGDGRSINFDHPDSLDWKLLAEHLALLKRGEPIEVPTYEFSTHKRLPKTHRVNPKPYTIIDGILIFVPEIIVAQIDIKIFISTREELRFERRLKRDVAERGRKPEGVRSQFYSHVKPMHDQFVEPTKDLAEFIISGEEDFQVHLQRVGAKLRK